MDLRLLFEPKFLAEQAICDGDKAKPESTSPDNVESSFGRRGPGPTWSSNMGGMSDYDPYCRENSEWPYAPGPEPGDLASAGLFKKVIAGQDT